MDKPGFYEIRVEGRLPTTMGSGWFGELDRRVEEGEITVLSGEVIDQSALYGMLVNLHKLHMTLISVTRMDAAPVRPADRGGRRERSG